MSLNKEQSSLYRKTMEQAKRQLDSVDSDMEKILETTRSRLVRLKENKQSLRQIYESSATILGEKADLKEESEMQVPASNTALLEDIRSIESS